MSAKTAPAAVTNRAANTGTLAKLVFFSISLGVAPIATYFSTLWYIKKDDATISAIAAIVVANLVLVAYIISAVLEDQESQQQQTTKKNQ